MFDFFVFIGIGAFVTIANALFFIIASKADDQHTSIVSTAGWIILTIFTETLLIFRMLY